MDKIQNIYEKIKIGSYQGPIVNNDFDANLEKVKKIIEQTSGDRLDFLCFPETYLSGYTPEAIKESAVSVNDVRLQEFILWTKQFDTVFLVGMSEKTDKGIFNSQLVLYKGKVLGIQHKTMLTQGYDSEYFITDLDLPVFEAKGIKFGVCICHTTSFIEPAQCLRMKGARLLFTPHYNDIPPQEKLPNGEKSTYADHRQMVLANQTAIATLLKMVVVRSNIVSISERGVGSGDSNMWDMNGNCVAEGKPFTECVVEHEFSKDIFLKEHYISRKEVPVELFKQIYEARIAYKN